MDRRSSAPGEGPTNQEDKCAVAVKKCGGTVGRVPFNLAPVVSAFLKRSSNKALAEVTGSRVNRGAGYGLEIPCKYHFLWIRLVHQETKNHS